jgi:hypothetical protein
MTPPCLAHQKNLITSWGFDMPVKGVAHIKRNVGRWIANVETKVTEKVLLTIIMTGAGYAKLATPVDTAALINSQGYKLTNGGKSGVVFYGAGFSEKGFNYGLYLHENVDWKPVKKKNATPHFLSNAFESPEYQADYQRIIINGYRL